MFSRKKEEPPKKRRSNRPTDGLSQFGLMDVNMSINPMGGADDDEDDDDDLEAELLALTSGHSPVKPKRGVVAPKAANLDRMIAASMREIPSDEELSGDDDDPDLLSELSALSAVEKPPTPTPVAAEPTKPSNSGSLVAVLSDRLKMYQEAEAKAKTAGETTRARRFNRGIKTLNDMLKQAKAGRDIIEEDIPPPVAISAGNKPTTSVEPSNDDSEQSIIAPSRPAPPPPVTRPSPPPRASRPSPPPPPNLSPPPDAPTTSAVVNRETLAALTARRDEYKRAALAAKKAGDTETALRLVKVARQFEPVITAVENGQSVDLSQMPPPPAENQPSTASATPVAAPQIEVAENQTSSEGMTEQELYAPPPPPTTVKDALEQRLAKYRSVQAAAEEEGNSSKARRTGRIVKQYEDALKLHRAGKPVPVDELPTPPGFGPIPQEGVTTIPAPAPQVRSPSPAPKPANPTPTTPSRAIPPAAVTPSAQNAGGQEAPQKANVRKSPQSRQEKQLVLLTTRQKEFKDAALEAKRKGEISQAKEYLRLAKGFDPLIQASQCGLPVDMESVPVPPGAEVTLLDSEFEVIQSEDCVPGNDAEIFEKLEGDLLRQAKMCITTRDHFRAIGDVASANRFEQLALHSKKDLDTLRFAHRRSEPVPKFHYETKSFSIVQCCTDLGDNDLELTIIQGINYTVPNPKDVDTYVKFEFPYPNEDPPKDRTALVKDTNNPEYNAAFPLQIHRNSRACQRVFKRHSIKLEVWSRGGFLRSDTLIGTAMVKLMPLETKCTIHDSFDLLDGRRPVGGKLEVKVRLRNPMLTKQVEQINEKWLIIDKL